MSSQSPDHAGPSPPDGIPPDLLDDCAREAIHLPGSVQPLGVLLAFDPRTGALLQASANLAQQLPQVQPAAGATLASLFGSEAAGRVLAALRDPSGTGVQHHGLALAAAPERGGAGPLDLVFHAHAGLGIAEVYPGEAAEVGSEAQVLGDIVDALNVAGNLDALLDTLARRVKRLTGFDRVMVYRFDADWHGEVIVDCAEPDMDSLLGLHYPAGDIPAQARELYRRSLVRFIADVDHRQVPLQAWPGVAPGAPLDLSQAQLRSASPVHLQYLRNMGVRGTLTMSLLVEGRLWGMLACHHRTPATLPTRVRHCLVPLAVTAGFMIAWSQEHRLQELMAASTQARSLVVDVFSDLQLPLPQAVERAAPALLGLVGATGGVLWHGEQHLSFGDWPEAAGARVLERVRTQVGGEGRALVQSDEAGLSADPDATGWQRACGYLGLPLSDSGESGLLWLRPEQRRETFWGGNPDKPVETGLDAQGRPQLAPRSSFARWAMLTTGRSRRWGESDLAAARSLNVLRPLLMLRDRQVALSQVQGALRDLAAVQHQEVSRLAEAARMSLLRNVGHELRTPLNVVQGYTHLLLKDMAMPLAARRRLERIQDAADWMLEMVTDLLDMARLQAGPPDFAAQPLEVGAVLAEVVAEMRPLAAARQVAIVVEAAGPLRAVADAVPLRRVLRSLASNGVKYNRDGGELRFVLVDLPAAGQVRIEVHDTGEGLDAWQIARLFQPFDRLGREGLDIEGTGLGLAIARQLVDAMHGRLVVTSELQRGTCVAVELPRAPGEAEAAPG